MPTYSYHATTVVLDGNTYLRFNHNLDILLPHPFDKAKIKTQLAYACCHDKNIRKIMNESSEKTRVAEIQDKLITTTNLNEQWAMRRKSKFLRRTLNMVRQDNREPVARKTPRI